MDKSRKPTKPLLWGFWILRLNCLCDAEWGRGRGGGGGGGGKHYLIKVMGDGPTLGLRLLPRTVPQLKLLPRVDTKSHSLCPRGHM